MMALKRNQLQKAYLDRWQATAADGKAPLDGIIMAVAPWSAARLGTTQKTSYVGYTGVANLLGENRCDLHDFSQRTNVDKIFLHAPSL